MLKYREFGKQEVRLVFILRIVGSGREWAHFFQLVEPNNLVPNMMRFYAFDA